MASRPADTCDEARHHTALAASGDTLSVESAAAKGTEKVKPAERGRSEPGLRRAFAESVHGSGPGPPVLGWSAKALLAKDADALIVLEARITTGEVDQPPDGPGQVHDRPSWSRAVSEVCEHQKLHCN